MSDDYIDFKTGDNVPNWMLKVKPKGVKRSLKFNVPFRVWRNDDGVVAQIMYESDDGKQWLDPDIDESRFVVVMGAPTQWERTPVFYNVSFNYRNTIFDCTCERNDNGLVFLNKERGYEFR